VNIDVSFIWSSAQKIHASSATYLALMKDNAYELQLRGEIEVKVRVLCLKSDLVNPQSGLSIFLYNMI